MAEHIMTCPACGGTFAADDEDTLIQMVRDHAHDEHGMDLSEEKARAMLASQQS